jgi:tetratricopeptide (TPR) repeat protein
VIARLCVTLALAIAGALVNNQTSAAPIQEGSAVAVLERFESGEFEPLLPRAISLQAIGRLFSDLRRTGPGWIDAAHGESRERRRRIAALVTLEAAAAAVSTPGAWDEALYRAMLEWGCGQIRRGPPDAFQLRWLRASIALVHAAGDLYFLTGPAEHLEHARQQYPDDPRFALAAVIVRPEVRTLTNRPRALIDLLASERTPRRQVEQKFRVLLDELHSVRDEAEVGAEASLRAGILLFHLGELEPTLPLFDRAAGDRGDELVGYLGHLFRGLTLEALGRGDEATAEYEGAVRIVPHARSGVMLLARRLFISGHRAEAARLLDGAFGAGRVTDPWRVYAYGDFRIWPLYRDALRAEVRR